MAPLPDGTEIPRYVFMGAEGRYEDYVYLGLLEREWKRPITDADQSPDISAAFRPSPRAVMALIFWTYFETRVERLLRQATSGIPIKIVDDLLNRHSSIGSRLDRLYRILFDTTYWQDLENLGFSAISKFLRTLQDRRNRFVHGEPSAIDEDLIALLVSSLKLEHESWIAVFNLRASHPRNDRP